MWPVFFIKELAGQIIDFICFCRKSNAAAHLVEKEKEVLLSTISAY